MPQAGSKNYSGQEQQQQTAQTVPYPSPYPQQFENDTIDLYELWITLWKCKWLVISMTVVAALGAIVYALQLEQIYEAKTLLLPPKTKDVQSLNILGNQIKVHGIQNSSGVSTNDVFSKFKQNLISRDLHKNFIMENDLIEILAPNRTAKTGDDEIYRGFAELIKHGAENGGHFLSIELQDGEIAAKLVNDFIEFVDRETINMLVDNMQYSILNQIRNIEYTIASKRQMAKKRREDMIIQYEEASFIASKLGVLDRVDSTNIVQNNQLNITTSNIPLYFRGYKALNAEIIFLKNRITDDPFIGGLRDLQEKLALLRSIKFDKEKMSSVHIDQAAYTPKSAIKPNRRLIVSLATVVGLFSGVFLVFFIEFVQNQKKKHSE